MNTYSKAKKAVEIVALYSLQNKLGNKFTARDLDNETGRIERIAETYYIGGNDTEYNQHLLTWVTENAKNIVSGKLDYDVIIPDSGHVNNLNNYCDDF